MEERLELKQNQNWTKSQVTVEELGEGRYRVAGVATVRTDGDGNVRDVPYTCEVAPDSSDGRGFRVTSVDVGPHEG